MNTNGVVNKNGVVAPPVDQQYDGTPQMRHPLVYENRNEKDDIMLTIISAVEDAEVFVKSISKVNHDEELRNMATLMIQSGMSVQDISKKLCDSDWYSWDDEASLQKTIHNWVKRYNLKW